jgi:putative transposase
MARRSYPTDLTDDEWRVLAPLIPPAKPGGRPRSVEVREIVNALRYVLRSGGAWRLLPHEFPPWPTVYAYFRRWQADGTWERVAGALRRDLRVALGRRAEPSAAVLDSQTVKTTEKGGRAAMTPARRPPAANGTPSSTPKGS